MGDTLALDDQAGQSGPVKTPKALLFDIGNVLVQWSPRNLYSQRFDDPVEMELFLQQCCTMEWHGAHDAGVPMKQNAAPLMAAFPQWEDHIRAWELQWERMFDGPVPGAPDLLADLGATGVPLYALSNMPAEAMSGLFTMFPFLTRFRDIVVSGVERVIKPDPAIFKIACERVGLAAEDIVFIDDLPINVEAAGTMGFDAIQFNGICDLREQLARRDISV